MDYLTIESKKYPVVNEVDVIVIGGGCAGVGAALGAARNGANVMLVERMFCLGGMMTSGLMSKVAIAERNKGVAEELLSRLDDYQGTNFLASRPEVPIDPEVTKYILDKMVIEEAGVTVRFGTIVSDVIKEDREIIGVLIDSIEGLQVIKAKYYIDCTGDGQLAFKAGASVMVGSEENGYGSSPTMMFRVGNCDIEKLIAFMSENPELMKPIRNTYSNHKLTPEENKKNISNQKYAHFADFIRFIDKKLEEHPDMFSEWEKEVLHYRGILFMNQPQEDHVLVNCTRIAKFTGIDSAELSETVHIGRKQVEVIFRFMRAFIPGFEKSFIIDTGSLLGIRESRRIVGDYIFTEKDVYAMARFKDRIVSNHGGIEIHATSGSGTDIQELQEGEYYNVPYRSIIAKDFKNLFMAGRCFSANHPGLSAARNIAYCIALGNAAGAAGAQLIDDGLSNVRDINIERLQDKIKDQI